MPAPASPRDAIAVIPARLASTRLPRKVLLDRTGAPLIRHVYDAARAAARVARVVVATDSEEVASAVRAFGAEAVLTSPDHPNGTSRIDEAAERLGLPDAALLVNVQGDEPEIPGAVIDAAVAALADADPEPAMATVASPLAPGDAALADPNVVKVVRARTGGAMYFSRAAIPHDRDRDGSGGADARPLRHVGIYAYRRGFLRQYAALPPTPLEQTEKLEQLRALEHGHRIAVAVVDSRHTGIDTPEQYEAFVRRWREGRSRP